VLTPWAWCALVRAQWRDALPGSFARRAVLVVLGVATLAAFAGAVAVPLAQPAPSSLGHALVHALAVLLLASVLAGSSAVGFHAAGLLEGETGTLAALAPLTPAARTGHLFAPALVWGAIPLFCFYAPLVVFAARVDPGIACAGALFGCLGLAAGPAFALVGTVALVRALGRERGARATRSASALLGIALALTVPAALRAPPRTIAPVAGALLVLLALGSFWAVRDFGPLLRLPMQGHAASEPSWNRTSGWRLALRGGAAWSAIASAAIAAYSLVQPNARASLLACAGLTAVLSIVGRVFADDVTGSLRWRLAPAGPSVRRELLLGVGVPTALVSWAVAYPLGPGSTAWRLAVGALLGAAIASFQVPPGLPRRIVHVGLFLLAAASARLA
jgi:hypothetical protein